MKFYVSIAFVLGATLLGLVPVSVKGQSFKCCGSSSGYAEIGGRSYECNSMADVLNNMQRKVATLSPAKSDSNKADKTDTYMKDQVDAALAAKADKTAVETLEEEVGFLGKKADATKSDVDTSLAAKADKTAVETLEEEVGKKADAESTYTKSDVDTSLAAKANTTAVETLEEEVGKKADADSTYTRAQVDDLLAKVYAAIEDEKQTVNTTLQQTMAAMTTETTTNGGGDDSNFNIGVAVGASVASVLLVGGLIAFIATRKNSDATRQRGGKKSVVRRGRQSARASQQHTPQYAYGEENAVVVQSIGNPAYGINDENNYEDVDEAMDANASTDATYEMPVDAFGRKHQENDNVQDDAEDDELDC